MPFIGRRTHQRDVSLAALVTDNDECNKEKAAPVDIIQLINLDVIISIINLDDSRSLKSQFSTQLKEEIPNALIHHPLLLYLEELS